MFRFLGFYSKYSFMFFVGEFFYYCINLTVLILGWRWIGQKLDEMGYDRKKVKKYVIFSILISIPIGFFSSRAAGIFYYPSDQWSLAFLLENALFGQRQELPGSLYS